MIDLLIHLIFACLIIHGVHIITRSGMILGFVENFWLGAGDPKIGYPLTECTTCMSSVWGVIYYLGNVRLPGSVTEVLSLVGFCVVLAGLNSLINEIT